MIAQDRTASAKVIGVGCMRTGSTTLGKCLEILGYKHRSYEYDVARRFTLGDRQPAFERLSAYDSFEDWPYPRMYREIAELYPDAKFILTTRRDAETWLRSMKRHSERTPLRGRAIRKFFYGFSYPHNADQAYIRAYERHNQEVRDFFGPNLLELCWENGDGWDELCSFLGHDVPDRELPHSNRGKEPPPLNRALNKVCIALERQRLQLPGARG